MAFASSLTWLEQQIDQELGVSDWFPIDQRLIDHFSVCTLDNQWIHVDTERARRESAYRTTIAHGYLILSLLPHLRKDIPYLPPGVVQSINYGIDYLRFLQPVPVDSRIRLRMTLSMLERRGEDLLLKAHQVVDIDGAQRPALVADTLTLLRF